MSDESRKAFEAAYPHKPYAAENKTVSAVIHYMHLEREWDGFQKGWQAATELERESGRRGEREMTRSIPFDPESHCEACGSKGAFDFMGDLLCERCAFPEPFITLSALRTLASEAERRGAKSYAEAYRLAANRLEGTAKEANK